VDVSGWADESDSGAAGFGSVDELSLPSQQENGDASPALPSHGVVSTSVNGEVPHEAAHEERSGLEDKPASISTHDSAEGEVLVNMAHADTSKRKRSQQEETLEAQAIHAQACCLM
jgi:hypothetical protein